MMDCRDDKWLVSQYGLFICSFYSAFADCRFVITDMAHNRYVITVITDTAQSNELKKRAVGKYSGKEV